MDLFIVYPFYVLIAFCAMIAGGFWGLGGGLFVMPALLISGVDIRVAVPACLLQMVISSAFVALKQARTLGWGKMSIGRSVALPLILASLCGALVGKPLAFMLVDHTEGSKLPQYYLYLVLLSFIFYKTIRNKKKQIRDVMYEEPVFTGHTTIVSSVAGFMTGIVATILGVGGGVITRPVLSSGIGLPEKQVGRVARISIFCVALFGVISYLFTGNSTLDNSSSASHIIAIALALSVGGIFGFSIGARYHRNVVAAGKADDVRIGFLIILTLAFFSVVGKLFGYLLISRITLIASAVFICIYLTIFNYISRKEITDENQIN